MSDGRDPLAPPSVIYLPDERQRTKKVTSGSEKRQRTCAVRVRLTKPDKERLKHEAAAARMSLAGYLATGRLNVETATRPRMSQRSMDVDVSALMQALVAFSRAGNNHNQMARALNELVLVAREQGNTDLEPLVRELADAIRGLPDLFAVPIAAIHAALSRDHER